MLVLFTPSILNIDDEVIKVDQSMVMSADNRVIIENGAPKMTGGKDLTLGLAAATALQNNFPDEQNLAPEKKITRLDLALRIYKKTEPVEVTIEELAEIKHCINKHYGTLVYARAHQLLEANTGVKL